MQRHACDHGLRRVRNALPRGGGSLAPIASCLMEAVGDRDRELLDELEALIAAKRRENRSRQL